MLDDAGVQSKHERTDVDQRKTIAEAFFDPEADARAEAEGTALMLAADIAKGRGWTLADDGLRGIVYVDGASARLEVNQGGQIVYHDKSGRTWDLRITRRAGEHGEASAGS